MLRNAGRARTGWAWLVAGMCVAVGVVDGSDRAVAAGRVVLWELGAADNLNTDFALAPQGYQRFREEGFHVVGRGDPRVDWPYVHPGPDDGWAGGRRHAFTVVFGLKAVPVPGEARLVVDLLDTQASSPPRVRVEINGTPFEADLPAGAGDASVYGEPARGREHVWSVPFPGSLLRAGDNEVILTTLRGSWMLYDSVRLEVPPGAELSRGSRGTRLVRVEVPPLWERGGAGPVQSIRLSLRHVGEASDLEVDLDGKPALRGRMEAGLRVVTLQVPAAGKAERRELAIRVGGVPVASTNLAVGPPKIREVWVLPHSHVDVGYTHLQPDIVRIQVENMDKALALAAASAGNPEGERFQWNPETTWVLDHYLRQATPERREALLAAVRRGEVGVDALYGNMLTGLCRPEELLQSLADALRIGALSGVPVESAAICDVPGWTWGVVPAMAQAGVKYFAIGPNHSARIGTIHRWDNRPFYWRSPEGRDRLLCWVVDNYHHLGDLAQHVAAHVESLAAGDFAYDMSFLYWVGTWPDGGVDNAPPDAGLVGRVQAWNARFATPRVVIGRGAAFFREFERRHGERVPELAGDLTPYWEDGAGSSSRETGMNRASAERLVQAEALFARSPGARAARPAGRIEAAWKNVLLYSEHTWGAHNSVSSPDLPFVLDQWRIKQRFALDADTASRDVLQAAVDAGAGPAGGEPPGAVDVLNTTQWARTDLVVVPQGTAAAGAAGVVDDLGRPVPSQRLGSGELAFLAQAVPAFGARRFRIVSPAPGVPGGTARVEGTRMATADLVLELDPGTGAIRSLRRADWEREFVDPAAGVGLNDYRYVLGTNVAGAQAAGAARITVVDPGPLVVTVRIESEAPGCRSLVREMRMVDGLDRVDLVNHVDRLPVRAKDSVHFGFGFQVPGGTVRMETPWAVVRPNADQLPGSCRNWFTVQRWVDVSNADSGVTWAPVDAPLVEVGGMTANLMGSVSIGEWLAEAPVSATLYSWAQNNHWFTNYRADQPGVTSFRYRLRPHRGGYSAADAARLGLEASRPLVVAPARGDLPAAGPLIGVSSPDVLVETVKTSEDGRAVIVRLFGMSDADRTVRLDWGNAGPESVWRTDLTERPLERVGPGIAVPRQALVSLRAEFR